MSPTTSERLSVAPCPDRPDRRPPRTAAAKPRRSIAASAIHAGQRVRFFRGRPRTPLLAGLAELAEAGQVRPVVDQVFSLDQVAHAALERGGVRGKHVIRIADANLSHEDSLLGQ